MIIWWIISRSTRCSRCWKREQVTEPVFISTENYAPRGFSRRLPRDKLFVFTFTRLFTSPRKLPDDPDIKKCTQSKTMGKWCQICWTVLLNRTFWHIQKNRGLKRCLHTIIPDICHGRHGRRPCKFFLPGVKFSRLNAKNLPFYTMAYCL